MRIEVTYICSLEASPTDAVLQKHEKYRGGGSMNKVLFSKQKSKVTTQNCSISQMSRGVRRVNPALQSVLLTVSQGTRYHNGAVITLQLLNGISTGLLEQGKCVFTLPLPHTGDYSRSHPYLSHLNSA